MAYINLPPPDHGLIDFGCNSYGGIAYKASTLENLDQDNCTPLSRYPPDRFITEHNIAAFWHRPGLCPSPACFPTFIPDFSDQYSRGATKQTPIAIRCDIDPAFYRKRNLLCGRLEEV